MDKPRWPARPPVSGESRSQLLASHFKGEVSFADEREVTGEGRAFCQSLLGREGAERPSSQDCESHAYVKRGPQSEATSTTALSRRGRHLLTQRFGKIQVGPLWFVRPSHIACERIAKRCLEMFGSLGAGEHDAEPDSEVSECNMAANGRFAWSLGRGGLRNDVQRHINPVACFVVSQLQHSHLFRFQTARLFPRVLYGI
jgi:hypothetical protein